MNNAVNNPTINVGNHPVNGIRNSITPVNTKKNTVKFLDPPNILNPDPIGMHESGYRELLNKRDEDVATKILQYIVDKGIDVEVPPGVVEAKKAETLANFGVNLDDEGDDKYIYIRWIAMEDARDLTRLLKLITG